MFAMEPWLAFFHISAVIGWVVFASAQTALCRSEWLNAAALRRLLRLDTLVWVAAALVLASGLLRVYLGKWGAAWYWGNWLLHAKLTFFAVMLALQVCITRRLAGWRAAQPALPSAGEVRAAWRLMMVSTHIMALLPLAAVFMARGFGARG